MLSGKTFLISYRWSANSLVLSIQARDPKTAHARSICLARLTANHRQDVFITAEFGDSEAERCDDISPKDALLDTHRRTGGSRICRRWMTSRMSPNEFRVPCNQPRERACTPSELHPLVAKVNPRFLCVQDEQCLVFDMTINERARVIWSWFIIVSVWLGMRSSSKWTS
jgi:hypothetical protein